MSYRRKDREKKEKDKSWEVIRYKFHLGQIFNNSSLSGYYFWPQFGVPVINGSYTVYSECGTDIIDPIEVQGTRIVKNFKVKLSLFINQIHRNLVVVIYKYNKAFGGRPCCNFLPPADESLAQGLATSYTMPNYQNVLGQTTFSIQDDTEHVICVEDDIILESGDTIRASVGNMPFFGQIRINTGTNPPTYDWVNEDVNGGIAVTGTVEGAIAFL